MFVLLLRSLSMGLIKHRCVEDAVPQPQDPYGIAKYAFEMELKANHDMFGLNYIIFRPHNMFTENFKISAINIAMWRESS